VFISEDDSTKQQFRTHVLPSDTTVKLLAGSHAAEYAFYLAHAFNFRYYQEWTYWLAEYNYMNGSSAR
jgi:hypothetical protein